MTAFHVISAIAIFSAAIIPIYISIRVRGANKIRIRTITIILAVFILIHGLYHLVELFGYHRLGEGLLEPLSVVILILFGIMMIRILYPNSILTNNHRGGHK
jgi:chromate transport protein ChrA